MFQLNLPLNKSFWHAELAANTYKQRPRPPPYRHSYLIKPKTFSTGKQLAIVLCYHHIPVHTDTQFRIYINYTGVKSFRTPGAIPTLRWLAGIALTSDYG